MTLIKEDWTVGCEHELGDWCPAWSDYDTDWRDVTMVNSNGIAVDPKGITYIYGGEIKTTPSLTAEEQVSILESVKGLRPKPVVNYRSNLHVHVRVPGLRNSLGSLKQVQAYIHQWMPALLPLIEPIPKPLPQEFPTEEEWAGAKRRYKRRKVSHHTLLTAGRLQRQLVAEDVEEFFRLEPPQSKQNQPLWVCQPRLCVNLRQLLETDTVEFRHFPGTLDSEELTTCIDWCKEFLLLALLDKSPMMLWENVFSRRRFPQFPSYIHWMEKRYRATCHDGTNNKERIKTNIALILEGKFDGRDEQGVILPYSRRLPRQRVSQPFIRSRTGGRSRR